MFRYFSSLLWSQNEAQEEPLTLNQAYDLINNEETQEKSNCEDSAEEELLEEPVEEIKNYEVCSKTGKITKITDGGYLIDDLYYFKSDSSTFLIGSRISYQIIKSFGELKVVDVSLIENDWDVADTGKKIWHSRTLVGTVERRNGRTLHVVPGNISVNLNDVPSEFIPIVGDWVELLVKCEIDEKVNDLGGKILEINKILPLRPHVKLGKVTQWFPDDFTGRIEKNIFFNKESLYCGYVPMVGDKVVAEIIESNQYACTWRALKILPDYLQERGKSNKVNTLNDSDFKDTHEGLSITSNIVINFSKLGEEKLFTIEAVSEKEMPLICVDFPKINGQCRILTEIDHCVLRPNLPLSIRCECKAKQIGDTQEAVIFHLEDFKIKRWILVKVDDNRGDNYTGTYNNKRNKSRDYKIRSRREVIRGQNLYNSARFTMGRIENYHVPEHMLSLVAKYRSSQDQNGLKLELEKMKPFLITPLNFMNYEVKFHALLHLDEIHSLLEMQNYEQAKACFIRNGEYLLLRIENLSEKRPSVILGDRVYARSIDDTTIPDYEGTIHRVAKDHVFVKFPSIFHDAYDGEDYSVYVVASRVTYKREHHAVRLAVKQLKNDWLFPTKVVEKPPQVDFSFDPYYDEMNNTENEETLSSKSPNNIGKKGILEKIRKFQENNEEIRRPKLEWYNNCLNYFQKEAVRNILLGVCRPLPYVIFGPPGTGKTVTLVETILQILKLMPEARVLVSAPSNSAADLLALRLIDCGVLQPGDLIRLVAVTAISSVPTKLAPYCATGNIEREGTESHLPTVGDNGMVLGYSSSVVGRHKITVCTCSTAGLLYQMGFPKGHFSHIIIDEAGQTSEPSVLIPLSFLDCSSGQAVMAGDPMQLGPVILCRFAALYGLEESLLERLINRCPYARDPEGFPKTCGYDPRLITKLIYNYRSLPDLLKLPSVLFYNDDLLPTISPEDSKEALLRNSLKDVIPLTKDGTVASVVFHGVDGRNFQNDDSPSWYNPNEAAQVFDYVNELYRMGLKAADIGIITPYKAQVKQLLELFREANFEPPKVGTVEEFQGQEFNVIILSTVRSSNKYVQNDIRHTLGFISNPRRLNVSITRAKSLLVMVGNPKLLMTDRCWRSVITYCVEKGTFIGCSLNSS